MRPTETDMKRGGVGEAAGFVLVALVIMMVPALAQGKCPEWSIHTWPDKNELLPIDGKIFIAGYTRRYNVVRIIEKYNPRLVGNGKEIPLTVADRMAGGYMMFHVLLVPARELEPGVRYSLELTGLEQVEIPSEGAPERKEVEISIWTRFFRFLVKIATAVVMFFDKPSNLWAPCSGECAAWSTMAWTTGGETSRGSQNWQTKPADADNFKSCTCPSPPPRSRPR